MLPLDYHLSDDVLHELARLSNGNRPHDDRFIFDLSRPLRLVYGGGAYWELWGVSLVGGALQHVWVQCDTGGCPYLVSKLERCHGIEWTEDPLVALERLLELELRRATKGQENTP
jgi:hypothetical protein